MVPTRREAYQRGVDRLIEKVHPSGAKLILMTPPPFDPLPLRDKRVLQPLDQANAKAQELEKRVAEKIDSES